MLDFDNLQKLADSGMNFFIYLFIISSDFYSFWIL